MKKISQNINGQFVDVVTGGISLSEEQIDNKINKAISEIEFPESGLSEQAVESKISNAIDNLKQDSSYLGISESQVDDKINQALEGFSGGITEEQVDSKIDEAIKALPSDVVSTEAKVNELIDAKLENFESNNSSYILDSSYDEKTGEYYRLYSDGWLEQGGIYPTQVATSSWVNVTLKKEYRDLFYNVQVTCKYPSSSDGSSWTGFGATIISENVIQIHNDGYASNNNGAFWKTSGYYGLPIINDNDIVGIHRISTGGGSGTWSPINANGIYLSTSKSYFDNHPIWGNIKEEIIDEQFMIRIPKFYLKNNEHREIWISPTMKEGFHCHPAFMHQGQEIPCFWIGKYAGYNQNGKMCSIPDVYPTGNVSRTTCESLCAARNVNGIQGFMLESVYQWQALNFLMLIEMQTTDMQSVLGRGHVDSSSALKVDHPNVAQATYRGIVGLWGNIYHWIQGLETSGGYWKIWDNKGNQELQTTDVTHKTAASWTYITSMATNTGDNYDFGDVFLPNASQSNEGTYANGTYSDAIYGGSGGACGVGGYCGSGSDAGPFCMSLTASASYTNTLVGCRLCKI